jgi:predicted esterase
MSAILTSGARAACGLALAAFAVAFASAGCRDLLDVGDDDATSCMASSECAMGQVCNTGVCGMPGTSAAGEHCWASRDCEAGLYCSPTQLCAAAGTGAEGAPCSADVDCAGGLRCDLHGLGGACATEGAGEPGAMCGQNGDCLAGLYCSADMTCQSYFEAYPPFTGVTCTPPAAGEAFRPYFEVPRPSTPPADFYRLPFPNDIRVSAAGLDMTDFPRPGPTPLGVDLVQLYVDALVADFDGFAASGVVTFRFAGELDFPSASGDTIQFVDVTAPGVGGALGLGWSYSSGRTKYSCESRLTVRADVDPPLQPKHTYAVILTTGLKGKSGQAASQDPDFAAMLQATRPTGDEALSHAWDTYAPLRRHLTAAGKDPATIAAAAVFTVQDTTGHMQRLAAAVAAQPAPTLKDVTLCDTGVVSPCDDGTPAHACPAANPDFYEIHGKISLPIYQEGTAPYLTPGDGGGIVEDASGVPQLVRTEDVCFALTVPRTAAPGAGWPIVITGHGTGGSMRSFVADGVAAKLATGPAPAAAFGFDEVEHGARRGASTASPNDLVFNVLNPHAARDNLLQGAADVLTTLRVAELAPFAAGAAGMVKLNPAKVAYFGHSQGSSSGEPALAFSSAAGAAVLSGAGSFLTSSLLDKTSPVNIKAGMAFLLGDEFDGDHPVMTLFQTYFERSDPLDYVHLLVKAPPTGIASKHVLMTYGKDDTFTPRSTLRHNAKAMGIPAVAPTLMGEDLGTPIARPIFQNLRGGDGVQRTAACFEYAPDAYDGHFVAQKNAAAVSDWSAFLSSYFVSGMPNVP